MFSSERRNDAQLLHQALAMLPKYPQRWYFLQIAALLVRLEAHAGHESTATDLHHEVRTILKTIIDHIPEGELRASFVALPKVQAVLNK